MVRRICPICDQIMKSAHYCRNCKSFVRNPYIRETDYYLNERHPASEEHCSFHDPWEEEKGQKPAKAAMPNVSANRQRSINPNVYGGAKDRSEQARQVAAMARGESRKTTNRTSMMSSERTQTVMERWSMEIRQPKGQPPVTVRRTAAESLFQLFYLLW